VSKVNPQLVYWIAALYDDPDLTAADRDVLTYLGVKRLDFGTGAGYCSIETLVKGTDWSESTVKRALARGQEKSHIERTRRGNRSGDGALIASEWQVLYPASTGHRRPVEESVGVTGDPSSGFYGSQTGSLQVTPEPPTGFESSTGDDDARAAAAAAVAAEHGWPREHAERVIETIIARARKPVSDPARYVAPRSSVTARRAGHLTLSVGAPRAAPASAPGRRMSPSFATGPRNSPRAPTACLAAT
jgi:hypothetical protein